MVFESDWAQMSFGHEYAFGTKETLTNEYAGITPSWELPEPDYEIIEMWQAGAGRYPDQLLDGVIDLSGGSMPIFIQNAKFLKYAFGLHKDEGTDVAGGGGSTLSALAAIGANTVTLTAVTNYSVDDYIQIGVDDEAEIRKITAINGNILTLDKKLYTAHASGQACNQVTTPYTHTFKIGRKIKSFTLESVLFGDTNLVRYFQGCKVTTLELSASVDDKILKAACSVLASKDVKGTTASTVTKPSKEPFKMYQAAWTYFGGAIEPVKGFSMSLDNAPRGLRYMRSIDGQYLADIVMGKTKRELRTTVFPEDTTFYDQLKDRSAAVDCEILFTRGANDTLKIEAKECRMKKAPHPTPEEGEVTTEMIIIPRYYILTVVDTNPYC